MKTVSSVKRPGSLFFTAVFTFALVAPLVVISCSSEAPADQPNDEQILSYQIAVTDTYGAEIGDSLTMIGSIDDFCYHPDGSILVMDQTALCVRKIHNGEVTLISRAGSGPGELALPTAICCLSDGRIIIADEWQSEVMQFSSTGEYLGAFFNTDIYAPHVMNPAGAASFTGSLYDLQFEESSAIFTANLARFESSMVPVLVYTSIQFELPDPNAYREIFKMDYTGAPDGTFYATMDNTEYSISVYSPSGELTASINCTTVAQLPKSEEEITEEIAEFERFAVNDQSYTGGYQPNPNHTLISLIGVDTEGNLWVQRWDTDDEYLFEVWDCTGNLVKTVTFRDSEADRELTFHVDQYGILAAVTDPDLFPQVLVLEPIGENSNQQE